MSEIKNKLSLSDKENIKQAVLESIAKQSEPAEELAKQACKAISYINNYDCELCTKKINLAEGRCGSMVDSQPHDEGSY